ncbi:MAG TPA: ABC transporter substrate-binding protein [Burkholderiaceae bacterium]|nr:ABC transporter substrate-binding protein [Burkholderiaceae bacterium]
MKNSPRSTGHRLTARRRVVKTLAGAAAAPLAGRAFAQDRKPIVIAVPTAQSGPAGVADHADYLNGAKLAVKEINDGGGVRGRPLELKVFDIDLLTPEGTQATFRKIVDAKVQAIASAFVIIPIPALETVANFKVPYINGNTAIAALEAVKKSPARFGHVFSLDPPETYYGAGLPSFLEQLSASGAWKPANNKVHIVQEQIAYTQTISKATQEALKKSRFQLGRITDIQFPVQDWGPVLQDIRKTGAGVVMIDHWVAAEEAAFAKQFAANPLKDALVYLQYGPSQPEFLNLAGPAAEGFVWGTVYGAYADAQGKAFRSKYQAAYPGVMGLAYTGGGYDSMMILAQVWKSHEPEKYKEVVDALRKTTYRGVNGFYQFDNPWQAPLHYPLQTQDLEKGMAHLFFQVQGGQHRIIAPDALKEVAFKPAPWMTKS